MIHTVKFNKPVTFTDHTGVTFHNITTGEDVANTEVSSVTVSPAQVIEYDVTWVADPIAGDVVQWNYNSAIGNYADQSDLTVTDIFLDTFTDTAGKTLSQHVVDGNVDLDTTGNGWVEGTTSSLIAPSGTDLTFNSNNIRVNMDAGINDVTVRAKLFLDLAPGVAGNATIIVRRQASGSATNEVRCTVQKTVNDITNIIIYNRRSGSSAPIGSGISTSSDVSAGYVEFTVIDDLQGIRFTCEDGAEVYASNADLVDNPPTQYAGLLADNVGTSTFFDEYAVTREAPEPLSSQSLQLTNCLGTRQLDFPVFGHDPDAIISASLKSAGELDGGTMLGTPTYDPAKGVLISGDGIQFLNTTGQDGLYDSGRITLEVEGEFLTEGYGPTVDERLIACRGGGENFYIQKSTSKALQVRCITNGTNNPFLSNELTLGKSEDATDNMVRVDLTWEGDIIRMYADYLLVFEQDLNVSGINPATFNNIYAGSNGNSPSFYIRNFEVSTRPITVNEYPALNSTIFMGDSFTAQGQYPYDTDEQFNLPEPLVGNTVDYYSDSTTLAFKQNRDVGILPTIQRRLQNINTGMMQGYFYGRGGSQWSLSSSVSVSKQIDCLLTGTTSSNPPSPDYPTRVPKIVIIQCGTNDVNAEPEKDWSGVWTSDINTSLDRLVAAGATDIFISNVIERIAPATPHQTRVTSANAALAAIASSRSEVYLCDSFTATGGFDNDAGGYLNVDGVHPSPKGSRRIGDTIASVMNGVL